MQRRTFITRAFSSSLAVSLLGYFPRVLAVDFVSRQALASLPMFLDTLLPAGDSPAATELDIDRALVRHATTVENYPRLLQLGCEWLDTQAEAAHGVAFRAATAAGRVAIVARAASSPADSLQQLFFSRVKSDTFTLYYSRPESWSALGFSGPPQPLGYPDFSRPPRVVR